MTETRVLAMVSGSIALNDGQLDTRKLDGKGVTLFAVTVSNFEIISFIS